MKSAILNKRLINKLYDVHKTLRKSLQHLFPMTASNGRGDKVFYLLTWFRWNKCHDILLIYNYFSSTFSSTLLKLDFIQSKTQISFSLQWDSSFCMLVEKRETWETSIRNKKLIKYTACMVIWILQNKYSFKDVLSLCPVSPSLVVKYYLPE